MTHDPDSSRRAAHSASLAPKLIALAQIWRREIARELSSRGLSDATILPLVHLARDGDAITQRCLAARVGVENTSLARILDALEQSGAIRRVEDPSDRRAKLVYLTPEGAKAARHAETVMKAIRERVTREVATEDLAALDRAIDLMLGAIATPGDASGQG